MTGVRERAAVLVDVMVALALLAVAVGTAGLATVRAVESAAEARAVAAAAWAALDAVSAVRAGLAPPGSSWSGGGVLVSVQEAASPWPGRQLFSVSVTVSVVRMGSRAQRTWEVVVAP